MTVTGHPGGFFQLMEANNAKIFLHIVEDGNGELDIAVNVSPDSFSARAGAATILFGERKIIKTVELRRLLHSLAETTKHITDD